MKCLLVMLIAGHALSLLGAAPSRAVTAAEYFWDTDPGAGAGTPFPAADGTFNEAVEALFAAGITPPSATGAHIFNARIKDPNGAWSPLFKTLVHVSVNNMPTPRLTKVIQAEFFWDTDPGVGFGSPLLAIDGTLDETIEALYGNAIALPTGAGPHTFNVRIKDADAQWSPVFATVVHVGVNDTQPPRLTKVIQAEYFWDTDPGVGQGNPLLALDGALNETVEALFGNAISVPAAAGPHTFNVRVKDAVSQWSPAFTTVVQVTVNTTQPPRLTKIIQAEYFWDTDPGIGLGNPLLALDGMLDESVESLAGMGIATPAATGLHTFNVRVRDADAQWSSLFTTIVNVITPAAPPRAMRLVQAEYFWDTDPGPGAGTPLLAADGAINEAVEALFRNNISPPGTFGPHKFHVRTKDVDGQWSPVFATVVNLHIGNGAVYVYTDDDDGDTLPNLVEYFLGTNPDHRDNAADYISWGFEPLPGGGPDNHLFVAVNRNSVALDATLEVQVSTNLIDWHGVADGWVVQSENTPSQVRFHTTNSIVGQPRLFFRLSVKIGG